MPNQTGQTSQITISLAAEPDTLKKQTCYRESVYILLFPPVHSLCLFSLQCLGWQLLDCFTSWSLWWWLLRGKIQAHNLFLLTAIHFMFVSGCPFGQYCLDTWLKCESRAQDTTGQDKAWISILLPDITQTIFSIPCEEKKMQLNLNSFNINWKNFGENSDLTTVTKVKHFKTWTRERVEFPIQAAMVP